MFDATARGNASALHDALAIWVDKEFGTGALKITPAHDPLDYEIGKSQNLPMLQVIGKDGKLTELAGELAGLKVAEGRLKAAEKRSEEHTSELQSRENLDCRLL